MDVPEGEARDSRDTQAALFGTDETGSPFIVEEARGLALRDHRWKLVARKNGTYELYDLTRDVGEENDVAGEQPAVVEAMSAQLAAARGTGLRELTAPR